MSRYFRFIFFIFILICISCEINSVTPGFNSQSGKILFYAIHRDNPSYIRIYVLDGDGDRLTLIKEGFSSYPTWMLDKGAIAYQDLGDQIIKVKYDEDGFSSEDSLCSYGMGITFIRYSEPLDCFLCQNQTQIFLLYPSTSETIALMDTYDTAKNPVTSQNGKWIYFSTDITGTFDIYRVDTNGKNYQKVLSDNINNLHTFSISADGKILVSPRYSGSKGDIILYDLIRKQIIKTFRPFIPGIALYTSLSHDNRYIYFVNGIPDDYDTPRNVYRLEIENSELIQLTDFDNYLACRPLAW